MNYFNFVSCYGIIILWLNHYANAIPQREVRLVITRNDEPTVVHLRQSKSFLANENLPIWMVRNGNSLEKLTNEVMQKVVPFTAYQDPDSSSAAVYFHNQRVFDGTIDARYIIRGLVPDNDDDDDDDEDQGNYNFKFYLPIFERKEWGHADKTCVTKSGRVTTTFESEWIGDTVIRPSLLIRPMLDKFLIEEAQPHVLSQEHQSRIFYVETLVVINHKMAVDILEEYSDVSGIVAYVLTLFNTVDMLFTKFNPPNVRINIAGIIIEDKRDSIPNMATCYEQIGKYGEINEGLNVNCVDDCLRYYLPVQKDEVLLDSYDVFVYLARYPLFEYVYNEKTRRNAIGHLAGITSTPPGGTYKHRKKNSEFRAGVMIEDTEYFESFATIAHEIVHAIGVPDHDEEIAIKGGVCTEKLMKEYCRGHCTQCLDWSDSTKELVKSVFESPDSCIFINEPRSLYPPGPRLVLGADEQCQCYGYAYAQNILEVLKPQESCSSGFPAQFHFCDNYLHCMGEDNEIYLAPVPMDGTSCGEHKFPTKVCWNRVCEVI